MSTPRVILRWQDTNNIELGHKIYRSVTPMDIQNMPAPIATLNPNTTEYTDEAVIEGNFYYYRVSAYTTNGEEFSNEVYAEARLLGPGSDVLIAGDMTAGFFGEVDSSELITGDALAMEIGLSEGTSINNTTSWLKFSYEDKVLFIPKLNLRYGVTWRNIYDAGALYGTDDTGIFPTTTPKVQDARVTVGSHTFRVRLIRGNEADPSATLGREWTSLFYPIHSSDITQQGWGINYSNEDIGLSGYIGLQERHIGNTNYPRVVNAGVGIDAASQTSSIDFGIVWRPVLELIA